MQINRLDPQLLSNIFTMADVNLVALLLLVLVLGSESVSSYQDYDKYECKIEINRTMSDTTEYFNCTTPTTPHSNHTSRKGRKNHTCCDRLNAFTTDWCNGGTPVCNGRGKKAKINCTNCPTGFKGDNCTERLYITLGCFYRGERKPIIHFPNCTETTLNKTNVCTSLQRGRRFICKNVGTKTVVKKLEYCSKQTIHSVEGGTHSRQSSDAVRPATKFSLMCVILGFYLMLASL